jgi:hypothetical protein
MYGSLTYSTGGTRGHRDEKHSLNSSSDLKESRDLQQFSEKVRKLFVS